MAAYGSATFVLTVIAFLLNPYAPLYFLIVWMPLQTGLLSFMADTGMGSDGLIRYLAAMKEVVALCWTVLLLVRGPRATLPFYLTDQIALILVCIATLYLIIPDRVFGSMSTPSLRLFGLRTAIVPFWAYFLGRTLRYDPQAVRRGMWLLVVVCLGITVFGMLEFFFIPRNVLISGLIPYSVLKGGNIASYSNRDFSYIVEYGGIEFKRMMSIFLSPLGLAYFLILPVSLALAAQRFRTRIGGLWPLPVLFVLFASVILSGTRAVIASVLLAAILLHMGKKIQRPVIMVSLAFLFISISPLKSMIIDTVSLEDPSAKAHLFAYVMGIDQVFQHPFGIGLGQAGPNAIFIKGGEGLYGKVDATVQESLYLTMAVEQGVPTVILFLTFAAAVAWAARRCQRASTDPFERAWTTGVYLATIGFAFASIPTEHWVGFQSAFIYWWFAGMAVQRAASYGRETRR